MPLMFAWAGQQLWAGHKQLRCRFGLLSALILFSATISAHAQTLRDRLILTADISATGKGFLSLGGEYYNDDLTVTAHGMITYERDLVTPSIWNIVATNFAVQINGSGVEENLGGNTTWTYIPGVPDDFSIELGTSDFGQGILHFHPYNPEIWYTPSDISETFDAREWLLSTWNDYNNDTNTGIIKVPTNDQPFTVSQSESREDDFPTPPAGSFYDKGTFNVSYTVTYQPKAQHLTITSVQTPVTVGTTHTFISTDTITVQAALTPAVADTPVSWAVTGENTAAAAAGTGGVSRTDASGVATFSFQLSQSPGFVSYRYVQFTTGSRAPNDPIILNVKASANGMDAMLSQTTLGALEQDETDTLRQEYVDFHILIPTRGDVEPSLGPEYNGGNYNVQLSDDLDGTYQRILTPYRGSTITVNGVATAMPASATVRIASGYRNPRRNVAAGSAHPNSKHVYGRALDLVPEPTSVIINGHRVHVPLHPVLYPALAQASQPEGTVIVERNGVDVVSPSSPSANHVHVQW